MKSFRTVMFWIQLAVGSVAGLAIFIMPVTGVALTYEKQVLEWADCRAAAPALRTALMRGLTPQPPEDHAVGDGREGADRDHG